MLIVIIGYINQEHNTNYSKYPVKHKRIIVDQK